MSEKTRIYLKFALILLVSLAAGMVIGILLVHLDGRPQMSAAGMSFAVVAFTVFSLVLNILSFLLAMVQYRKYRKLWNHGDVADEILDGIEYRMNYPILLTSVVMILNMFLYAAEMYFLNNSDMEERMGDILMIFILAVFILGFIWILTMQSRIVALCKEINPEKKGELLDLRFHRVWMDSCDEWEKLATYKAGFTAYRKGSIACSVCWVIAFLGCFLFDAGVFPVLLVCVIWLVLTVSYARAAMELEKPQ